jgi:7-cyano-7-deazaguanine synthase
MAKKAVVLLSGGLDSATCLAVAKSQGFECYTLSFDYGQRNRAELLASQRISKFCGAIEHKIFDLNLRQWGGSALTDDSFDVPKESAHENDIPITYVPARNLVFLSLATAWGEVVGAKDIFIGVNSVDYSNYPDCRDSFIKSFSQTARLGTKACDENWQWKINTPLQNLSKAEIIKLGTSLGLDYSVTLSCYDPTIDGLACGECASCRLRKAGFADAGVPDPTRYK